MWQDQLILPAILTEAAGAFTYSRAQPKCSVAMSSPPPEKRNAERSNVGG
jgi:hypothetical protein